MSGYAALMALSASQTRAAQDVVQQVLAERQRKEQQRQKEQALKDAKDREAEKQARLKRFEAEKKEQERLRRKAEEQKSLEAARIRREEEQRDALRYGPKKAKAVHADGASKWPSSASHSQTREDVRRRRVPDDDERTVPTEALTREELRERKMRAEQKKMFMTPKRSATTSTGTRKMGKKLPGGGVDVPSPSNADDSPSKSIKERIAAMPNALVKLNTVKRDTRTIDEIVNDLAKAKAKTLEGDNAKGFDDWFSDKKSKASSPAVSGPSRGNTPSQTGPQDRPASSASGAVPKKPIVGKANGTMPPLAKPIPKAVSALATAAKGGDARPRSSLSASSSKATSRTGTPNGVNRPNVTSSKKRTRSESPQPNRKRRAVEELDEYESDYLDDDDDPRGSGGYRRGMIFEMFGKNLQSYAENNIFSDDEDMEAGASDLEREEKISSRVAKREDDEALAAEKRHEAEKARRKKEKFARY